jgi:hypothetical protein
MKKKFLSIAFIATIAVTAGWNFTQSKNKKALSDLALENVEALASSEGYYKPCVVTAQSDGYGNYFVRKCSTCSYVSADFFGGDSYCGSSSDL